jgi:hypothetical protein
MSMGIGAKLLDFIHKLYSKVSMDQAVVEVVKGKELVIEIQFVDCPEANFQLEAHEGRLLVHKGTPKLPKAVLEYEKVEYLKDYLSGRMSDIRNFMYGKVRIKEGEIADIIFLEHMEKPLRRAWIELRKEFPGLP